MADFSTALKSILTTGAKTIGKAANATAKAIGRAASSTANNTRYKMNEMSTMRQRSEMIGELGAKVYELAMAGAVLPAEAAEIVAKIKGIDSELDAMRSEHQAQKAAAAEQHAAEKAARAAERAAAKAAETIEKSTTPVDVDVPAEEAFSPVLDVDVEVADVTVDPTGEKPEDVPTLNVPDEA